MSVDSDDTGFAKRHALREEALRALSRLEEAANEASAALKEAFDEYENQIDTLAEETREASEAVEEKTESATGVEDAVHRFCDVVQRPVGTRDITIPKSAEATRAVIGLYDSIGRNL